MPTSEDTNNQTKEMLTSEDTNDHYLHLNLFEDPDFPAEDYVLHASDRHTKISWKRPWEIVNKTPVFIREATYYDIFQGNLGDCFIIASVNALMVNDNTLLNKIIPRNQGFGKNYDGSFRFYFWQFGDWKEVRVDDRLPTWKGDLIYTRNKQETDEFWVCLLEKAYAKFRGTYAEIHGGDPTNALVDLTGGVGETIFLDTEEHNVEQLFNTICKMWKMDTLIVLGTPEKERKLNKNDPRNSLVETHAYAMTSITKVLYKGKMEKLIRLRNPYGDTEWVGAWSDGSDQWKGLLPEDRKKYDVPTRNEGEFWIPFKTIMEEFNYISLCHQEKAAFSDIVNDTDAQKIKWCPYIIKDRWMNGLSSGGHDYRQDMFLSNPQYTLDLSNRTDNTWVVISLMKMVHGSPCKDELNIGYTIYKLKAGVSRYESVDPDVLEYYSSSGPEGNRELSKGFELPPGTYVLLVYNEQLITRDYLLRIYSECTITVRPVDGIRFLSSPNDHDAAEDHLEVAFEKHLEKTGRNVDAASARSIMGYALRKDLGINMDLSLESIRCLMRFSDHYGLIGLNCLRKAYTTLKNWIQHFSAFDKNNSMSIEIREFMNLLVKFDVQVGRKVAVAIVNRYAGRNGRIDFDDLIQCICRIFSLKKSYTNLGLAESSVPLCWYIAEAIKA